MGLNLGIDLSLTGLATRGDGGGGGGLPANAIVWSAGNGFEWGAGNFLTWG
jgi:hypothetical protein